MPCSAASLAIISCWSSSSMSENKSHMASKPQLKEVEGVYRSWVQFWQVQFWPSSYRSWVQFWPQRGPPSGISEGL